MKTPRFALLLLLFSHAAAASNPQPYLLPQVADGSFPGGYFRTTFVLVNNGDQPAAAQLRLTSDDGTPLTLTLPESGTGSDFKISLAAGAAAFLQSDGSGPLKVGAAQVTTTTAISVSALFSFYDGGGRLISESGIGSSFPALEFVLPVDTTGSSNTGVALFNAGPQSALLTFRLYDPAGQAAGPSITLPLAAGGHLARLVAGTGQLFPTWLNFRGTLVIAGNQPVAAITLRQNASPLSYTSLPAVARGTGRMQSFLPHIAGGHFAGGTFKTKFAIFNMSETPAAVSLVLTADAGEPLKITFPGLGTGSEFPIRLPVGGSVFLETDGEGALSSGAASMTSNAAIGASAIFTVFDAQGKFIAESGVGDSPLLAEMTLPVLTGGGSDTGVAFFNPGSGAALLNLSLLDGGGAAGGTRSLRLAPKQHQARFISELFPGRPKFSGSLAIAGSGDGVSAVALRQISAPLNYTMLAVNRGLRRGANAYFPVIPQPLLTASKPARDFADLTFTSYDGMVLKAVSSTPKGDGPFPLIVTIHGGNGNRDYNFLRTLAMPNANSPTINLLNDQQWIIVAIDYRAGLSLVNEEEDCRYGVRFAKSLPKVDRARVGVMGGSHGGQHAMRMAETMGTEILCAVIGSPFMTDPQTFLYGSPDEYPIALLSAEAFDTLMEQRKSALPGFNRMSPAARDKLFAEHSCERNTKAVEVPLLLLTSRADMNVNHLMVEGTINNLLADGKNVVNFISEVCFHGFYWGRVESPNFPDKTPAQLADEATARGYELGFFEYWFAAAHALPR